MTGPTVLLSAKPAVAAMLLHRVEKTEALLVSSASFLAEISVQSPRKLFIFIIVKKNLDQSIQKKNYFILKMEALLVRASDRVLADVSVRSRDNQCCRFSRNTA